MRFELLGENCWIVRELSKPAYRVAEQIENANIRGVLEVVSSFKTVGVYFDDCGVDLTLIQKAIEADDNSDTHTSHIIPVCFDMGQDLQDVIVTTQAENFVSELCAIEMTCFAIGFCPGFPYLGYLPPELSKTRRRKSPRIAVPAGSVAVAGDQIGIYPEEHPGGWNLIGKTPLVLVDESTHYFPIHAGDKVRFEAIDSRQFQSMFGQRL